MYCCLLSGPLLQIAATAVVTSKHHMSDGPEHDARQCVHNNVSWIKIRLNSTCPCVLNILLVDSGKQDASAHAQLRTGCSPLLAAYLHRIGRRDSATCPHCNGADETAEHLVLHCPAHDQARRESWPNLHYQSDQRRLWSFLERIGAVTCPPDRE